MAKRGPRTEAGRRRSALNAVSHGVLARTPMIPGVEAAADWDRHLEGFRHSLAPATPFEAFLVDRIAFTAWRLQRLELYETEMLSLAQLSAEEAVAARILAPAGGAITLQGTSAAALIANRIDQLRRLAGLLITLHPGAPAHPEGLEGRTTLPRRDLELLYEGLDLTLSRQTAGAGPLQRQVIDQLTAGDREEEDKARALARNVSAILREMEEALEPPSAHAEALEAPTNSPLSAGGEGVGGGVPPATTAHAEALEARALLDRYPVELVLVTVWPEIRRLERELPDLDSTIARIRSESLLLQPDELAKVTRYEAHLRRQLVQYLHELEALQSKRDGQPATLARLDVQLLDT